MTPSIRFLALIAFVPVLSCASSSKHSPPAAGASGWSIGDPITTPVSDGTPVQLPDPAPGDPSSTAPAPDAGPRAP